MKFFRLILSRWPTKRTKHKAADNFSCCLSFSNLPAWPSDKNGRVRAWTAIQRHHRFNRLVNRAKIAFHQNWLQKQRIGAVLEPAFPT